MRALSLLLALAVPLLGCDMRSDAEKALEQRRIAYMQETNAKFGGPDLQHLSGGKRHTTVVRIAKVHGKSDAEKRGNLERTFESYGNAADDFKALGFTHVTIRDMETGLEVTKAFSEISSQPNASAQQ